jgi:hypothetical protein
MGLVRLPERWQLTLQVRQCQVGLALLARRAIGDMAVDARGLGSSAHSREMARPNRAELMAGAFVTSSVQIVRTRYRGAAECRGHDLIWVACPTQRST